MTTTEEAWRRRVYACAPTMRHLDAEEAAVLLLKQPHHWFEWRSDWGQDPAGITDAQVRDKLQWIIGRRMMTGHRSPPPLYACVNSSRAGSCLCFRIYVPEDYKRRADNK